jgi:serine/threonine protein kinase/tetratricopeptide (TPR) repeat protein
MDKHTWDRIQRLFHEAADLDEAGQEEFLSRLDDADAAEVRSLLHEDSAYSLIDRGLPHLASDVFSRETPGGSALPENRFGPYRITGVLGEGGMGIVYLAERSDIDSKAAIKILRDAWLSPARRERFLAEQRTLAQLEHPGIARLYDSGTLDDGTPWFVMENVEGVPVTRYCRANSCDLSTRLSLFRQVCEAVQFAHSNLVIHRDLKPSNILVRADGNVKLLDFGISKHLESEGQPAEQTQTAVRLMTPAYAAPEQIRGGRVGLHTDVYSLGVVLYELLVGRLPFDLTGHSASDAERILLEKEPERPSVAARRMEFVDPDAGVKSVSRSSWADLDVLCMTAMHKDPLRRYRTVEALARDVDRFLRGEALEARGDSLTYKLAKFGRRNRAPILAAGLAATTMIGISVFYTARLRAARNTAIAEAAKAERIQKFTLNLLQGGEDGVGPADSLRVVSLIDRGVQEARSLNHEPAMQAQLFETLGSIYHHLGKIEQADTLLRLSLDRRRALYGPSHPDVAQSLVALGMLRNAEAEYDSAEALVSRGISMTKQSLPSGHPSLLTFTTNLGQVLDERGDYDRAIAVLNEALAGQAPNAATPELAATLTELANAHFYKGNYATADTINRRVLALDRRIYGPKHPSVANDLINLGAVQFEFGKFAEAERFYREALTITRPWYGNNHPATAANLTMLGRALVSQQKLDEGSTVLTEAVQINERAFGPVHPRVASALNELGRVAQQQGRLDEAEANFRRMAQIYKTVHKDKHYVIGVALSNIAGVMKDRKRYEEASRLFEEVLRRYADELDPDHQLFGIARIRHAEVLVLARRYADAEREALAGYSNISKQASPPAVWIDRGRGALAMIYDSTSRPAEAAKYRKQLAAR